MHEPPSAPMPSGHQSPFGHAAPSPQSHLQPQPSSGWALVRWTAAYLLTWWFGFVGISGQNWLIFQLAWLGLASEGLYFYVKGPNGHSLLAWLRPLDRVQRLGAAFLVVCLLPVALVILPFWPAGVLFRAIRDYYASTQLRPGEHARATWQHVRSRSRAFQAGMATAVLVGACALWSMTGIVMGSPNGGLFGDGSPSRITQSTATTSTQALAHTGQQPTATATAVPTATPEPTATATPTPTPTPLPTATPKPTPRPKPTATPVPQDCLVICNPWGYDFRPGNLIYSPPSAFCSVFPCIPSFWNQTNGYVVECQDGKYSHSGGRQGVCSYHGGYKQTLYDH